MKKQWLGVVSVLALLAATPVWAAGSVVATDKDKEKEEHFQARKAREVKELELRLACLKGANSPADVKKCQEAQKERHQAEQMQRIQEQRKRLDERESGIKEQQKELKEQKDQREKKEVKESMGDKKVP